MLKEDDVRKTLDYIRRNCGLPNGQGDTWSPNRETKAIDAALQAMDELKELRNTANVKWVLISSGIRPEHGQLCWITRVGENVAELAKYKTGETGIFEYWLDEERDGEWYEAEEIFAWMPYVIPEPYCDHD